MQNTYRLAGHAIEIKSIYKEVHMLCAPYLVDDEAEYHISITSADIDFERQRSIRTEALEHVSTQSYTDSYLETLAVYRKLAQLLVQEDILLMHGSVVAVDGQAYLFTAKSGIGKTTHTSLWMQHFGARAVMVNGDKPLLHVGNEGVTVYGTPWDGKERLSANIACPLKAVCILTRSEKNHIKRISKKDALPMLCQQIHRPEAPDALIKVLALVDQLGSRVPLYRLECNMNPEAALVAYRGMNQE